MKKILLLLLFLYIFHVFSSISFPLHYDYKKKIVNARLLHVFVFTRFAGLCKEQVQKSNKSMERKLRKGRNAKKV